MERNKRGRKKNNRKVLTKTTFLQSHFLSLVIFSVQNLITLRPITILLINSQFNYCVWATHANTKKKFVRDTFHRFAEELSQRDKEERVNHAFAIEIAHRGPVRSTIGNAHSPTSGPVSGGRLLAVLAKNWKLFGPRLTKELRRARDRDLRALCRDRSIGTEVDRGTNYRSTRFGRDKRIIATRCSFHVTSSGFIVALRYYRYNLNSPRS